jgi:hypothetical protein
VGTSALRDGSVSASKLAADAVGRSAVAPGAIGSAELAPGAVDDTHVAQDALGGADIRERTLSRVPSASDAVRLGGVRAGAYLWSPFEVSATSVTDTAEIKGPLIARCPAGARVLSGGAAIEGAARGAAIVRSLPDGRDGWTATARVARGDEPSWRLVVTAICSAGGR